MVDLLAVEPFATVAGGVVGLGAVWAMVLVGTDWLRSGALGNRADRNDY